jgi:hypothetical protein
MFGTYYEIIYIKKFIVSKMVIINNMITDYLNPYSSAVMIIDTPGADSKKQ